MLYLTHNIIQNIILKQKDNSYRSYSFLINVIKGPHIEMIYILELHSNDLYIGRTLADKLECNTRYYAVPNSMLRIREPAGPVKKPTAKSPTLLPNLDHHPLSLACCASSPALSSRPSWCSRSISTTLQSGKYKVSFYC